MVETLFCRVTAGVWMSRSSLVWGPFSVVWGLALVMAAVLLRGSEERSDRSIFLFGFVMGGAYEYICSAVGELLFGVIFWDYSGFKFNLGGRVNLLYCFFWGIAAVVWIRYGYPLVAKLMANLKKHILPWMTVVLTVFMAVNMGLSALALAGTTPAPAASPRRTSWTSSSTNILTTPGWSGCTPTPKKPADPAAINAKKHCTRPLLGSAVLLVCSALTEQQRPLPRPCP